jgi:hypothetical protein
MKEKKMNVSRYDEKAKGTPEMRRRFEREMEKEGKKRPGRKREPGGPMGRMQGRDYHRILEETGIPGFRIHEGDDGRWIQLWK